MSEEAPKKNKAMSMGTLYEHGYLLRMSLIMAAGFAVAVLGCVVFGYMALSRGGEKPWVIRQEKDGSMVTASLVKWEVTPEMVFEYCSYVLPRLYLVDSGAQPGLESLSGLVSEGILVKEKEAFKRLRNRMEKEKVVWQASTVRLVIGTPDKRGFVISRKYGLVRAMVEGRTTIVSESRNSSDVVRWDVELEIVAPSPRNLWGLRLVKVFVNGLDASPIEISDILM